MQGKDGDLFSVFSEQLSKIIDGRESMALEHVLGMQVNILYYKYCTTNIFFEARLVKILKFHLQFEIM